MFLGDLHSGQRLDEDRLYRERGGEYCTIREERMITKSQSLLNAEAAIDLACEAANSDTALIRTKCRALIAGYDRLYCNSDYVPLEVEKTYTAKLINPETNYPSKTFTLAGKIDVLCQYHNKLVVFDHKTTSQDISDPAGTYWRQLVVEGQANHYMLLLWLNGQKCDDAVWDIVRKPQISPKKLSKTDIRAIVASREYCGAELSTMALESIQIDDRETYEMYEARLVKDCTVERPEHYFQRRSVPRLDSELMEYARELWEHSQEMLHARSTGRNARNSGACMLYGSPCKFLGICSRYDKPDSDRWAKKTNIHVELPELYRKDGDYITNSRVRCFQTCRRKHQYDYELAIERIDEEEREALLFGTIWHEGLRGWWSTFLKEPDNGNGTDKPAGIGLASNGTASEEVLPF
jgi:hypothetical protein